MNTMQNVKQFTGTETLPPAAAGAKKGAARSWELLTGLNQSLAHAIDLRSRTKQTHWSAKGGNFHALHKMFADFSSELDSIADELAERIMALGGLPVSTPSMIARISKLPPCPIGIVQATGHFDALVASYEVALKHLAPTMNKAVPGDDHATASILTGFARLLKEQKGNVAAHIPVEWATPAKRRSIG